MTFLSQKIEIFLGLCYKTVSCLENLILRRDMTRKVGLVQINNSFSGQNYFPLSAGLIQAYAEKKEINDIEFLPIIFKRSKVEEIVSSLKEANVVGFSTYIWNMKISLAIAENIKKHNPNTLIVFGGHHVPEHNARFFLEKHRYVDVACHGDGEVFFSNLFCLPWEEIPGISFIDKNNKYVTVKKTVREKNLDNLPSPYLSGVFDRLIRYYPDEKWIALMETNRGCPHSCVWCDWHDSRLGLWSLDRIFAEIEWFAKNKIEFVNCVDANFGIFQRDKKIAEFFAETKAKYGYPKGISVQSTKNIDERYLEIQEILARAELNKTTVMSVQSLNPETLAAVGRKNVDISDYRKNIRKLQKIGVSVMTDMILGQPEETYSSWLDGYDKILDSGQHNRIQFINLAYLPNSRMSDSGYLERYRIKTVESDMVNNHGKLPEDNEFPEKQDLVIATNTLTEKDWIRARVFSWMASLLHFDKLMQIPFLVVRNQTHIKYSEMVKFFSEGQYQCFGSFPVLNEILFFFEEKAEKIQKGGYEFHHSSEWLDIFWPVDEYIFIKLCLENKLDDFYRECGEVLSVLLKNTSFDPKILSSTIDLNKNLIKIPGRISDIVLEINFNIWEYYQSLLTDRPARLEKKKTFCLIDRTSQQWLTVPEWLEKVVWWGTRRGSYLYTDISVIAQE